MGTPVAPGYPAHWEADIVLRDGGTAQIRPITPEDAERLVGFFEQVSDESKYLRFFAPYPRLSDRDVHRFTHHDYVDRVGLAATIGDAFIATVRYDRIAAGEAEVAFLVQDSHQGRGVASALLEHIAACARERGIRRFAAEVLPGNSKMIKVFTDAGYTQKRTFEDGVVRLEFDLEPTDRSLGVMRAREQRAEARSVQRLVAPRAVAVIGAGRRPGGVGRTVLRNLRGGGFAGALYAVNHSFEPGQGRLDPEGVEAFRSIREIEGEVDLAVIAVPAGEVPGVLADCGEHGVQGLLVLSAGFTGPARRELLRQARSYGMRLIGPTSFGLIGEGLNASLAPHHPKPGRLGLFTQSGGIGIAVLTELQERAGVGISSFVSVGDRTDVSGNDFLQYWHDDPGTDVVLMYLESMGNPRKFTRLARRTAQVKPLIVVKGARHTGSEVIPDETVSALLAQAGVIRVNTVAELADAGLLLGSQPLPAGARVAILGNSDSLNLLTYDTCRTQGLRPLPPLDLTGAVGPADFARALAQALADVACDAVILTAVPWVHDPDLPALTAMPAPQDAPSLANALREAVAGATKPVAVVHLAMDGLADALAGPAEQPPAGPRAIPAYPAAERAAGALARAVAYAQWRREAAEPGTIPEFEDLDEAGAAKDIDRLLAGAGDEVRPGAADTAALLARYGIAVQQALPAPDPDAAAAAARRLGYPVALKTTAEHLRHRADLGGVRLDLADEEDLRRAYTELTASLGKSEELAPVVQAMAPRGVDTVVTATVDPAVGAVLSFGLAGPPSELLGDTAHRLVPVTDRDASGLIRAIRGAPLLFGWRGTQHVDAAALEELLLRLSLLTDEHPEIVAVQLSPVVVGPAGASVLAAELRLAAPPPLTDVGPRRLPDY